METQTKKPFYKKWWVWVIGVVVLFVIIGSTGSKTPEQIPATNTQQETATETAAPKPTVTETKAPSAPKAPAAQKSYQQVFTFNGNGTKKSEPFTVTGDRFKIAYDCTGDICQAFLYGTNGRMVGLIMNSTGSAKDETIQYGKGEYYIDANTMGNFTMTVYDYK